MYIDITPNDDRWYDLKDLPNERWKDIKNYEGLYQVSDYGRVKSLERFNRRNIIVKEKILKMGKNSEYRYIVILSKDGKHETKKVHRLVAEAFIPNPENKPEVNHIKPVTKEECMNRVDKLEWVTSAENSEYAKKLNRTINPPIHYGKDNNASHPLIQYDSNMNFIRVWECVNDVCKNFNIERHKLRNLILKNKTVETYYFKYVEEGGDEHAGNNI